MDNLKLVVKQEEELQKRVKTAKIFSDDSHMEFRLDTCTEIVLKKWKLVHLQHFIRDISREIQDLEQGKTGSEESEGMQHQKVKERLKEDYVMRLRKILKSQLNAKNKITEIWQLDFQVLRYSFALINWRLEELSKKEI